MSQFYQGTTAGSLPPTVPITFQTDSGTATAAASILNVFGETDSGVTTSGSGNTITINFSMSNVTGEITTSDGLGQTRTLISVPLGSDPGVYTVDVKIVAYCTAGADSGNGNGYTVTGALLTNGITGSVLGTPAIDLFEGIGAVTTPIFTTSGNNAIIQVTGIAGDTINWRAEIQYIFRGIT